MKSILLADDDAAIRETLGQVLILEQYSVIFAATAREAAAKLASQLPNLVLLDLSMADRDGWEGLHFENGGRPLVPVIIITAKPHQGKRLAGMGASALMEKPLDIPLLLKTIQDLVGLPEVKDRLRLAAA